MSILEKQKRFKCIACEIFFREFSLAAALSDNVIKLKFMHQGLHNMGAERMGLALQEEIDNTDAKLFDAILLGFGLCGNGVLGLHSELPLVIPRAPDCIPLLMGDRDKHKEYYDNNHGTFYLSPGWIERAGSGESGSESGQMIGFGYNREELVERYGEKMADYVAKTLSGWDKNYSKYTLIDTGTGNLEFYEKEVLRRASEKGWEYEKYTSENRLAKLLFSGNWNDYDFLVVPPRAKLIPTYDDNIVGFKL